MKAAFSISILVASLSICALPQAAATINSNAAADEQAIIRHISEINAAYVARNAEPFEQLYSSNFISIRARPSFNTREQLIAMMTADAAQLKAGRKLEFQTHSYYAEPVTVRVYGTAAIVTATKQNLWSYKGSKCAARHQTSELWLKRSNGWRLAANQTTTIPCSPSVWNPPHPAVTSVPNQSRAPRSPDPEAAAQVLITFNRLRESLSDGSAASNKNFTENFVSTDPSGVVGTDRSAFAALVASKVERVGFAGRRDDLTYAEGDGAIHSFRATMRKNSIGIASEELVQVTIFFVKANGEWLAAASHATHVASDNSSQDS